jgi:hypothetical protein
MQRTLRSRNQPPLPVWIHEDIITHGLPNRITLENRNRFSSSTDLGAFVTGLTTENAELVGIISKRSRREAGQTEKDMNLQYAAYKEGSLYKQLQHIKDPTRVDDEKGVTNLLLDSVRAAGAAALILPGDRHLLHVARRVLDESAKQGVRGSVILGALQTQNKPAMVQRLSKIKTPQYHNDWHQLDYVLGAGPVRHNRYDEAESRRYPDFTLDTTVLQVGDGTVAEGARFAMRAIAQQQDWRRHYFDRPEDLFVAS